MQDSQMKQTKGKKWIWLLALIPILAIAIVAMTPKQNMEQQDSVREIAVSRGDLELTVLATGVVQPENRLEIKPPIAGRMENVLVKEGQKVHKGQVLAWMSSTERAALLDAARAKGPEELKQWESYYKATPILAPLGGTVILRNVEPGQTFTTADAVLVMSDRLTVKAQVDETDIAQIRLKQRARIALDAYPKENFPAYVDQIAYDAKTVNNVTTYVVDVLPDAPPAFMRSGMTANVSFFINSKNNVLLVPSETIKYKDGKPYVSVATPDKRGKPIERMVEIGASDGKRTEILSGLSENDKVLATNLKIGGKESDGATTNPFAPQRPRKTGSGSSKTNRH